MSGNLVSTGWSIHLDDWIRYLTLRVEQLERAGDIGGKVKYERQLTSLNEAGYGLTIAPDILSVIIDPESSGSANLSPPVVSEWYQMLDSAQREAVLASLCGNPLTLILGPPGTGKTTVITETVLQFVDQYPNARVLIASESHVAVDNVLDRLLKLRPELNTLRVATDPDDIDNDPDVQVASAHKRLEEYFSWLLNHEAVPEALASTIKQLFTEKGAPRRVYRELANSSQIVVATCNYMAAWPFSTEDLPYDLVVVDEVCKATLPEVLVPLLKGSRALLVGDPNQLPPVFCIEDIELQDSEELAIIRECQYINGLFTRLESKGHVHMFNRQYRMPDELGSYISDVFYSGKLQNGCTRSRPDAVRWIDSDHPVLVPKKDSRDIYNPHEVSLVLQIIEEIKMLYSVTNSLSLAVITPYRAQQKALKKALASKVPQCWQIQIDTVDAFQGRDADVVIFSVARNHGSRRFFADFRRMNVALSRAKQQLWFVGSYRYLKTIPYLKTLHELDIQ